MLFESFQVIQFLTLMLFYKNLKKSSHKIDSTESELSDFIRIHRLDSCRQIINEIIEKKENKLMTKNVFLEHNEYFYFYLGKYLKIYFYKEKSSDQHIIFFDGLENHNDVFHILMKKINNEIKEFIHNTLFQEGTLYQVQKDCIIEVDNHKNLIDIFHYFKENYYNQINPNLCFFGYSFGGPLSYYFYVYLDEKSELESYHCQMNHIESWFEGDEKEYNEIKDRILIENLFNRGSILEIYNDIFQPFCSKNKYIDSFQANDEYITHSHFIPIFPFGILGYIKDHHSLKNILQKIKTDLSLD